VRHYFKDNNGLPSKQDNQPSLNYNKQIEFNSQLSRIRHSVLYFKMSNIDNNTMKRVKSSASD
jgi:hypothetical protein